MKKILIVTLFAITIGFHLTSCVDMPPAYVYTPIPIYNATNDTIVAACWPTTIWDKDTITTNAVFVKSIGNPSIILPQDKIEHPCLIIVDNQFSNQTNYQIIIFKNQTLKNHSTAYIIENNVYDKLYVLTYDELEAMGFKVIYHGD